MQHVGEAVASSGNHFPSSRSIYFERQMRGHYKYARLLEEYGMRHLQPIESMSPAPVAKIEPASSDSGKAIRQKDDFVRMMLFWPSDTAMTTAQTPEIERVNDPYHPLPQSKLNRGSDYRLPEPCVANAVRADTPAIEVMTDLKRVAPITIRGFASITEANQTMIARGVRTLFVVDDNQGLSGLVTATDILGQKPMQITQQRGLPHDEVIVRDIMTPAELLEVIELRDVLKARVGDMVATLKHAGRQHALVVDQPGNEGQCQQLVRGIFSLTQIARQLGLRPQILSSGYTFAEIEAAIGS